MNLVYTYWAKLGGCIAFIICIYVFFIPNNLTNLSALLWIHFITLLIHQFEEYVYPGGFKDFFNKNIWNKNKILRYPLNNKGIILVNVLIAWTAYGMSAFCAEKWSWLAIGLAGISILNGLMHTYMYIVHRKYNPGFLTGIFILIPFGIYLLSYTLKEDTLEKIISGIVIFAIGTCLIPLSIFITNKWKEP